MSANRRDKRRERYSRNTEGWNAQGFFSPDPEIAYGTSPTLQDLIYTGAPGEIGLFIDGASTIAPPAAGEKMIIAQKNSDETIKKSTELTGGQYTVTKTDYDAPVKQKDLVFPLNISIVGGLQEFVLSARETTPANQPFPIQEGRAIVRSGSPSEIDIAMAIVADMNNSYDFERNGDNNFVAVNVVTDAVGLVAPIAGTFIFTDGNSQVFVQGYDVTLDATPGSYLINAEVVTGSTFLVLKVVSSSFDAVSGNSTIETYPSFSGSGAGVETTGFADITFADQATIDAANVGITLLGVDELTHFDTSVSEDLGDAVVATVVDWNFGSGAAWQVASIEDECAVFDGFTTGNEAWVRDFGAPDLWVDDSAATQYALYIIESLNRIIPSAGAPQNQTLMQANIVIAAIEGSTLETNLDLIFA